MHSLTGTTNILSHLYLFYRKKGHQFLAHRNILTLTNIEPVLQIEITWFYSIIQVESNIFSTIKEIATRAILMSSSTGLELYSRA